MSEGPRHYLEIEIRRVVEAVIADASFIQLSIFADAIESAVDTMYVNGFDVQPPPTRAEVDAMGAAARDVRRQAR